MEITKSPYDSNEYRVVTLDNGVVALLISNNSVKRNNQVRKNRKNSQLKSVNSASQSDDESKKVKKEDRKGGEEGGNAGDRKRGEEKDEEEEEEEEEDGESDLSSDEESSEQTEEDGEERKKDVHANTLKSACAVCINTGSLADPPDIPGLAHLLEHMVFMGSEKYKGENTFDSFLSKHGGSSNASTDYEKTVFHFSITPPFFKKALDMFAHFFASPLLLESSLDREIEAVDSEFQMSVQSDSDRLQQLICAIANPDHPYANFVWGNTESLRTMPNQKGIHLGVRLREFYHRHYSSHCMTVAVMSTATLDDLETWTRASFSTICHNHLPAPDFKMCPAAFDDIKFHKLYKVVPVADVNEIQLVWQLPCLFDQYRVKPMDYLAWLVGHEGKGSVLYHLKSRNLATDISVGNATNGYEYNSCFSLFTCSITLTDKGQDQIMECLSILFQYLKLLRESGPQERIYREIQVVEENNFTFKEEEDPASYTEELCEAMQFFPEKDYLTGTCLLFEYNPEVITMVTELLVPEKVNVMWSSQRFKGQCQLKEKWFGTSYSCEDIPDKWKDEWQNAEVHSDLQLPQSNPFIATDFTIKSPTSEVSKYPVVLRECEQVKLWFRQDTTFKRPKAWVCLLLENPLHKISPKYAVLVDVFLELLQINMSDTVYNAEMAMLRYSCELVESGVTITVNGLNHKLPLLFKKVVDSVADFSTTQDDFDMVKEGLHRTYRNSLLDPDELCKGVRMKVLVSTYWTLPQKDDTVDHLTLDDLSELVAQFKKQLFAKMLVQGNISPEEAKDLASYLCSRINFDPLPQALHFKPCGMRLPPASEVSVEVCNRDPDCPNTVIIDYYQCCPRNIREATISMFLSSCMEEPAFDSLRTKKQLGYEVYSQNHNTHEMVGLSLTLVTQSSKHSVQRVTECMHEFVTGFLNTLQLWSAEEFSSHVDSQVRERLEPDISLEEEVQRNWAEIVFSKYHFDCLLREVEVLRGLSQEEVCCWLQRYTHVGEHHKKLQVKVLSQVLGGSQVPEETTDSPSTGSAATDPDSREDPTAGGVARVLLREADIDSFKGTLTAYPAKAAAASFLHLANGYVHS